MKFRAAKKQSAFYPNIRKVDDSRELNGAQVEISTPNVFKQEIAFDQAAAQKSYGTEP